MSARSYTEDQIILVRALAAVGLSVRAVARETGLSKTVVHRIVAGEPERAPAPPAAAATVPAPAPAPPDTPRPVQTPSAPRRVRIGEHLLDLDEADRVECPRCLRRVPVHVAAQHVLGGGGGQLRPIEDDDDRPAPRRWPPPW